MRKLLLKSEGCQLMLPLVIIQYRWSRIFNIPAATTLTLRRIEIDATVASYRIKSMEKSVRSQRICSPRSGVKDCLLTNPAKFRNTKEKFGHRRCREDLRAKYINRSEQLCKGPSGTRGASTSERGRYAEFE